MNNFKKINCINLKSTILRQGYDYFALADLILICGGRPELLDFSFGKALRSALPRPLLPLLRTVGAFSVEVVESNLTLPPDPPEESSLAKKGKLTVSFNTFKTTYFPF